MACFSSKGKLHYFMWLDTSAFIAICSLSSHGPWKMEARSVKVLLKAEMLLETAKPLS